MHKVDDRFWVEPLGSKKEGYGLYRLGLLKALVEKIGPTVFVAKEVSAGDVVHKGMLLFIVESTKAAMDIESPVDLEVEEINLSLQNSPDILFEDPEGHGWLLKAWIAE